MAQYKHNKNARLLLAEFDKERRKTLNFALLTFIVLMVAVIVCAASVSSIGSITNIKANYDPEARRYTISDMLS
jgi:hypothetical protein